MSNDSSEAEAVCFTAGPSGASFGAGVIHAWLAADRVAPRVVTGISTGAITAAAMQQAILRRGVLEASRTEASRWEWFQQYLTDIQDRPLDVIWKALPDPVDYFAATAPVRDLSCPELLKEDERASRYHFWMLTKVGNWLASLPISVGEIGRLAILKVRHGERIPVPFLGGGRLAGAWRITCYVAQLGWIAIQLAFAVITKPSFTRSFERFAADETGNRTSGVGVRPLFGWKVWVSVGGIAAVCLACLAALLFGTAWFLFSSEWKSAALCLVGGALVLAAVVAFAAKKLEGKPFADQLKEMAAGFDAKDGSFSAPEKESFPKTLLTSALKAAGVEKNLINNYQMKRRIWNRFADHKNRNPLIECNSPNTTNLVVVASVLQSLRGTNHQCWARAGTSLVQALSTACAIQPFYPPTHISGEEVSQWFREKELKQFRDAEGNITQEFDLVDGAVIRKNPLPALFNWLQEKENQVVARDLETASKQAPSIHVIYNVPIEPFDAYAGEDSPHRIDLIEAAEVGMLMRARRDTSVEVKQTNFLSSILNAQKAAGIERPKLLALFADEIAPARELKFDNPLSPSRDEGLKLVAEGCRRTLGRLYQDRIKAGGAEAEYYTCSSLVREIAPNRAWKAKPGLPEVCAKCDGRLVAYPAPPPVPSIVYQDYGQPLARGADGKSAVERAVPTLCESAKPKITFVASGGVFRGAFHIGLLAAMQALKITPDLVVGASVGTLMGAALAAIRNCPEKNRQFAMLADLTDTFMRVDETVALTVPLKTAVKQLGLRSQRLKLSPAALKAAVKAGTSKNVGYASTGVPPIVVDTLSQLFIIPPAETLKAGSDFLAGRFAKAAASLISLVRQNTLESLGIRYAVIGTSMLEGVARNLLGEKSVNLDQRQPYLSDKKLGTAIFCTTAYVNQRWPLLLGRDALAPAAEAFRFLYAALSSSAFPAAFPARQEAEVFPGSGLVTNLFCDGGTFDNLPFIPAIEILSATQKKRFERSGMKGAEFLSQRLRAPDLIIAGGFDPLGAVDHRQRFESHSDISRRCSSLAAGIKTDSFRAMSEIIAAELRVLNKSSVDTAAVARVKPGSVVAGVVNIVPATDLHVNPTFGFARSLGFQSERVAASIADGCFQTMRGLQQRNWIGGSETRLSLEALEIDVKLRRPGVAHEKGNCPYFEVACPFFDAQAVSAERAPQAKACGDVYEACCSDPVHQRLHVFEYQSKSPNGEPSPAQTLAATAS